LKSNPTPSDIQPHPIENSLLLQTHPIAHPIRFTTTSIAEPSKNPSLCHRLHHRTIEEPIPLPSQNHLCSPPNPIAQPSKPEPISVTITPISISANLKAIEGCLGVVEIHPGTAGEIWALRDVARQSE
ncbi:unnamed protein product, partial [Prunus brigantina]